MTNHRRLTRPCRTAAAAALAVPGLVAAGGAFLGQLDETVGPTQKQHVAPTATSPARATGAMQVDARQRFPGHSMEADPNIPVA